jgi:hypothetical protein
MENIQHDIDRILLETDSAANSLRSLYELHKAHQSKVSLSFVCRRAGIPSKGYLSFVMAGKRRLNVKYWQSVCEVFKLNYQQEKIMKLLLEIDFLECEEQRRSRNAEILQLRRQLHQLNELQKGENESISIAN